MAIVVAVLSSFQCRQVMDVAVDVEVLPLQMLNHDSFVSANLFGVRAIR